MHYSIIQELDNRIERLKIAGNKIEISDIEKTCIQSRLRELESMKNFVNERALMEKTNRKKLSNHEFWRLVDEF